MNQWGWIAALAFALTASGCDDGIEGACSDFCNDVAACFGGEATGAEIAECENDCGQDFADLPEECEGSAAEILNCSSAAICGESDLEACASGIELSDTCNEFFGTDGGTCCEENDPCDWANDGFCDCGGSFAWDAADCGS